MADFPPKKTESYKKFATWARTTLSYGETVATMQDYYVHWRAVIQNRPISGAPPYKSLQKHEGDKILEILIRFAEEDAFWANTRECKKEIIDQRLKSQRINDISKLNAIGDKRVTLMRRELRAVAESCKRQLELRYKDWNELGLGEDKARALLGPKTLSDQELAKQIEVAERGLRKIREENKRVLEQTRSGWFYVVGQAREGAVVVVFSTKPVDDNNPYVVEAQLLDVQTQQMKAEHEQRKKKPGANALALHMPSRRAVNMTTAKGKFQRHDEAIAFYSRDTLPPGHLKKGLMQMGIRLLPFIVKKETELRDYRLSAKEIDLLMKRVTINDVFLDEVLLAEFGEQLKKEWAVANYELLVDYYVNNKSNKEIFDKYIEDSAELLINNNLAHYQDCRNYGMRGNYSMMPLNELTNNLLAEIGEHFSRFKVNKKKFISAHLQDKKERILAPPPE